MHQILNNKNNLIRVARDVLAHFESINVVYLELRTTPRNIQDEHTKETVLTKKEYIEALINVIEEFETHSKMTTRLILSVDRAKPLEDGLETIELCNMFKNSKYMVGIDFSGNPKVSTLRNFKPHFDLIKKYGLKVTVHLAEIWEDTDVEYVLKEIKPDRIGHAVCLTNEVFDYLIKNPVPIEICPTSNLTTRCVDSIDKHPFYSFYKLNKNYPLTICTDDYGILNSDLTDEYLKIANAFSLSLEDMFRLSKNSILNIFDKSSETVDRLNILFENFQQKIIS